MSFDCSLMDFGADDAPALDVEDYEGPMARWCPGCGDHAVLAGVQRLLAKKQLRPERTVFVSGIGCSSRFTHYVNTYGFHGIHGRALPLATGIKLARPELDLFVVMGDGDCCSIGTAHWIHAIRYNINMTVLLLDNNIYGLTKKQTSPTTPQGLKSNTQPRGSFLPPLDPLSTTLGVSNASFVAQTADWMPSHLATTLEAAHAHQGFSFVRILQRCPVFTPEVFADAVTNTDLTELLIHEDGIQDPTAESIYKNTVLHDPSDLHEARRYAHGNCVGRVRLGLYYRNEDNPCYEKLRAIPHRTVEERMTLLDEEFDHYAI